MYVFNSFSASCSLSNWVPLFTRQIFIDIILQPVMVLGCQSARARTSDRDFCLLSAQTFCPIGRGQCRKGTRTSRSSAQTTTPGDKDALEVNPGEWLERRAEGIRQAEVRVKGRSHQDDPKVMKVSNRSGTSSNTQRSFCENRPEWWFLGHLTAGD